jgi:hypothetical protein
LLYNIYVNEAVSHRHVLEWFKEAEKELIGPKLLEISEAVTKPP